MDEDQQMLMAAMGASSSGPAGNDVDVGAMTEEEQIAYALQMSMADGAMQDEPMQSEEGTKIIIRSSGAFLPLRSRAFREKTK